MAIIAVVSNKGGTGKTTLAMSLAAGLLRDESVMLIDADPQQSAYQWRLVGEDRPGLPPVVAVAHGFESTVKALSESHQHLVIDCPPSIKSEQSGRVLRLADIALVPVQPSPMDLWATAPIARVIAELRAENPRLRGFIVMSQIEPRTTLSRLMPEAVAELDLPVAQAMLRRRSIHRHCALEGRTIFQSGRRGAEAVAEIDQLIEEIFRP
ncbi:MULTISPECIES: ParA family partition ATPase [Thiorhodovibrio]|uniref:ParA family partition ATPase n=1 Tax=Thiorhodovibrio TaxID=61593 RepID=UPI0019128576|nr:ParA family partition ATPase [Thiorhodovibrio litoralis]MBK5968679.1 cobyrinic acid a,c-diamide synthase [Thiorhodovibrio winogradskyi]WPL10963.1 ParA-like protein [Thiorhodovibrio litoralis]